MSHRKHRDLARAVRCCRKLSSNPAWVADVVIAALRHVGVSAAELRALAVAADAAAAPRMRLRSPTLNGQPITGTLNVRIDDQVVDRDEPIDRKTAASGG